MSFLSLKGDDLKVVVIGNGVAGEAACSAIRSQSREITITLISEDSYPFYSPCILARYISGEMERSGLFLKGLADYEREGIDLLLDHRVERIDPLRKRAFLPGREIAYDRLILATGSRPVLPRIEGAQKKGVMVFKSLKDADLLFQARGTRAVIVGSGPIGIELAIALRKKNWEVCLIEELEWILPNLFDERGASRLQSVLEKMGVEVQTGARVLAIEGKGQAEGVVTGRTGRRPADLVALTIGMRPNAELARAMGIEVGPLGGIRTNRRMETNLKDVYACGDCVETEDPLSGTPKLSLLWPPAERQGWVAGANCLGGERSFHPQPSFINLDIFGTFAGAMGMPRRLAGQDGAQVLERERNGDYHCVVISGGRLVGAQFIGYAEGMGVFLSLLGREYESLRRSLEEDRDLIRFPWYQCARSLIS